MSGKRVNKIFEPPGLAKFSVENLASVISAALTVHRTVIHYRFGHLSGSYSPPDCHSLPLRPFACAHYLRVMRCSNDVPLKIDILDRIYVFAFSPSKTPPRYDGKTAKNFILVTAVRRCYADGNTAVVEFHITFSFACDLVKNFESSLPCFSAK